MTGADIDLADLWRRTLLALESAGVSPSERAFVGFARLMAVIEQTALIAVPNDYTKKVLESDVRENLVRALGDSLGREIGLAVTVDPSLEQSIHEQSNTGQSISEQGSTNTSPGRRSDNQRHIGLAARHEAQLRGVIDQLVHRDRDEIHQHDLGHRTHANNRRTHCRTQDGLFRNGSRTNATGSVCARKALANLEHAAALLVPNILANAGGVTVSYFEWVQDRMGYFWSEADVNERLGGIMTRSFQDVLQLSKQHKVNMRTAAYMLSISRVATVHRLRGIYA